MSDNSTKWIFIAVAVIFGILGIGATTKTYMIEQVKIEAIKAGLVQDSEGHWVRPMDDTEETP
jgi:hypothetical protein